MKEKTYMIRCRHEVEITYKVTGASFEDALDKICGKDLFQQHGLGEEPLFGPCEYTMARHGVEVVESDCYGDPSPTGREYTRRDWEYDEE